jgi:hypothetical protein
MGEKLTLIGFISLLIGFLSLVIGMPLHNPYVVFDGYGICVIFPILIIIGITLEDM